MEGGDKNKNGELYNSIVTLSVNILFHFVKSYIFKLVVNALSSS